MTVGVRSRIPTTSPTNAKRTPLCFHLGDRFRSMPSRFLFNLFADPDIFKLPLGFLTQKRLPGCWPAGAPPRRATTTRHLRQVHC